MLRKVKILQKDTLYKGWSELSGYDVAYQFEDGREEILRREIYNSGDGASVLLYNTEEKVVLLVRQFRLAAWINGHKDGFLLETCAGMLDDRDPEAAMIREIEEETGYRVSMLQKAGIVYATPGAHMEKIHLFLAPFTENKKISNGGGNRAEQEEIEVVRLPFSQAVEWAKSGQIEDAKTLILIQQGILLGHITAG